MMSEAFNKISSVTALVEHCLIHRGVNSMQLARTLDVASKMIEAKSVDQIAEIMDDTLLQYPDADSEETITDAELLYWAIGKLSS
jgi:hypothetical protein